MNIPFCEKPIYSDGSMGSKSTSEDGVSRDIVPPQVPIDATAEKRLVRKLDLHVIPVIALLYMLAFTDRINIGNARIQGLEKDLGMKGQDYNVALFVFFIPYILFEVPSNILIRKIAPSTWLSSIMVCWGKSTLSLIPLPLSDSSVLRNRDCLHGRYKKLCWSRCLSFLPWTLRSRLFPW